VIRHGVGYEPVSACVGMEHVSRRPPKGATDNRTKKGAAKYWIRRKRGPDTEAGRPTICSPRRRDVLHAEVRTRSSSKPASFTNTRVFAGSAPALAHCNAEGHESAPCKLSKFASACICRQVVAERSNKSSGPSSSDSNSVPCPGTRTARDVLVPLPLQKPPQNTASGVAGSFPRARTSGLQRRIGHAAEGRDSLERRQYGRRESSIRKSCH
jgi:hypothetical protein